MFDSIMQWNIESYRTKFSELKVLLREQTPLCICLQETRITSMNTYAPTGYDIVHSPACPIDGHVRGVAIMISNMIQYKEIILRTDLQAVAVRINIPKAYTICSIYLPHTQISKQDITVLLDQLTPPFIILGDFNAHSPMWGSSTTSGRGRMISEILVDRDLCLLNNGEPTHFDRRTGSLSKIDLAIASPLCQTDFLFSVLPDLHDSDHFPIELKLRSPSLNFARASRFLTEKADWNFYRDLTDVSLADETEEETIEEKLADIERVIIDGASASMKESSGRRGKPSVPWWNDKCEEAIRARKQALRALRRNHNIVNKIAYNRTRAKCRNIMNQARKDCWEKYVSTINTRTSSTQVWKKINKIRKKHVQSPPISLRRDGAGVTSDSAEVANILAGSLASASSDRSYTRQFIRYKTSREEKVLNFRSNHEMDYNEPITAEEFKQCLAATHETSPGKDRITYSMIKNAHQSMKNRILHLYNRIFNEGIFPSAWRVSIIIPILKPEKDPLDPSSYRPISLTSCLCKLLEKILNCRLMWFLERNGHITAQQAGFRRNRSTTDPLVQVSHDIHSAISRSQHTIIVFFDISKAYDTAWRYGVVQSLHNFGMRGNLPRFIQGFLQERRIVVRVDDKLSEECIVQNGVPQGSVLSCTCFLIAINEITQTLPNNVRSTLYVDDYAVYTSGNYKPSLERRLQVAIDNIEEWSNKTGLNMSATKTKSLHVCKILGCPKLAPNLTLRNAPIENVDEYKFLGLLFDKNLDWRSHVMRLRARCNQRLNILKLLSHTRWGADKKILLRLYIALIKPKLDYGVEAYISASNNLISLLNTIQHSAIRISTGAFKSSPIVSLHAITGLKPPEYYRDLKIITYFLRLLVNQSHPLHETALQLEQVDAEENPMDIPIGSFFKKIYTIKEKYGLSFKSIYCEKRSINPPWRFSKLSTCNELKDIRKKRHQSDQLRQIYLDHNSSHGECITIYTDGSKTEEGVSYAIITPFEMKSAKIQRTASIFTAELIAIKETLIELSTDRHCNSPLTICTDSKSSIQSISSYLHPNPVVQEIQWLVDARQGTTRLCWVPSHVGVRSNELVDGEARRALQDPDITIIDLPKSDHRNSARALVLKHWNDRWRNIGENKLRKIHPYVGPILPQGVSCRCWEKKLIRLRIGHTRVTHGHLMDNTHQPYCDDCLVPVTVVHLLTECPSFSDERRRIFGGDNPSLRDILTRYSAYNGKLYKFLIETDLINRI